MKLTLQGLTHSHRLCCPYCGKNRLGCTGQENDDCGKLWLQCADCGCVLRLIFECLSDGRTELWLRDHPAVEDFKTVLAIERRDAKTRLRFAHIRKVTG